MVFWKDIDIELDTKNDGDVNGMYDSDAVVNSITNIVSTLQGSRRMLPSFASTVYDLLFDPLDEITAEAIGQSLLTIISNWDDRVVVEDILILPNEDQNRYDIEITISINNTKETKTINTVLNAI